MMGVLNRLNLNLYSKKGIKIKFVCVCVPGKTIKHITCRSHLRGFKKVIPIFHYAEYSIYEKDADSPCDAGIVDCFGDPYYDNIQPETEILEPDNLLI